MGTGKWIFLCPAAVLDRVSRSWLVAYSWRIIFGQLSRDLFVLHSPHSPVFLQGTGVPMWKLGGQRVAVRDGRGEALVVPQLPETKTHGHGEWLLAICRVSTSKSRGCPLPCFSEQCRFTTMEGQRRSFWRGVLVVLQQSDTESKGRVISSKPN